MKRTKIVCTIGPSCATVEKLTALVQAGMNVCRLNFSHGTHENHAQLIKAIRTVCKNTGEPLTILQDLQGPKIRVGDLPEEGILLKAGENVIFTTDTSAKPPKKIPVTYPKLHQDVEAGQQLLLDDGLLAVRVLSVKGMDVTCRVETGGKLTSHKGMNLPETHTTISAISEKDREDLEFGIEQGVDWIALSFVRSAQDIRELRRLIADYEKKKKIKRDAPIRVLAKIEKPEAVEAMNEIIAEVDGIMVARGDLGVEMPAAKVPIIQKRLVQACLLAGKPVIVATQMLDSMIRNPRATRAEISDVANAVLDRTDATMLSGETATGAYPVEAVQTMTSTIEAVEESNLDDAPLSIRLGQSSKEAMTNVASLLARASNAKAIVIVTMSGNTAHLVSRYRPELPIFAATPSERVMHQLNLSWGVEPFLIPSAKKTKDLIQQTCETLLKNKWLKKGEEIVLVAGECVGTTGHAHLVEIRKI